MKSDYDPAVSARFWRRAERGRGRQGANGVQLRNSGGKRVGPRSDLMNFLAMPVMIRDIIDQSVSGGESWS